MINLFQRFLSKRFLGIDIGTSCIKVVEIYKSGRFKKLENYGQVSSAVFYQKPFWTFEKNSLLLSNKNITQAIRSVIDETEIKTKQAIFSIPDFFTFFTSFDLPPMTKEELSEAVMYEAKQHIPLPLSEVVLDWQIIKNKPLDEKKTSFKILLVAVPKDVVSQYQEIAINSQLELVALEAEVFSLMRALSKNEASGPMAIIDIGAKTTACAVVDEGVIKTSHSFDMSGNDLTAALAKKLEIDFIQAEKIKIQYGVKKKGEAGIEGNNDQAIKEALLPILDVIIKEISGVLDNFYRQEKKDIQKIIITGGTALLPGLKEYFEESFGTRAPAKAKELSPFLTPPNGVVVEEKTSVSLTKKEIEIGNPFLNISYPPVLEKTLLEMGPSFAIVTGAALRGFQS